MIKHPSIYKHELPSPYTVKHINLWFMKKYKTSKRKRMKKAFYYEMHGKSFKEMKRFILDPERDEVIDKINKNFPRQGDVYSQSAYYLRAFSRSQIFLDANHRTGFFSLIEILRPKGYFIDANIDSIQTLGDYLKSHFYIHQGEIVINLKKRDEVYDVILKWLKEHLDLR